MATPYFRQLLAGREFARTHPFAGQMANFVYLIGDADTRETLIVDPAWDVRGLCDLAEADGYRIAGALITHYHPDHVGGQLFGIDVEGAAALLERAGVKLHVHEREADGVKRVAGVSESDLARHADGDTVKVGGVEIRLLHTPGHTPGSQCFLVGDRLVAGDTLFVQGCGRVDLPGSDPDEMYRTLTGKLAALSDDVVLYPGHHYADRPSSTMGQEKRDNHYLRVRTLDEWRALMAQR